MYQIDSILNVITIDGVKL